jgi:4-amino-4-deoxy-L-arabinose transferase-like glycosyltransferase
MILFLVALVLHGAILLWSLEIAYEAIPPVVDVITTDLIVVSCLVAFWIMLTVWPDYTHAVGSISAVLVASALLTPGVVIVVALMFLNAYIVGARLLAWAHNDESTSFSSPASVVTLVGLCAWIGLMSATASMKLHYAPIYVVALLVPLGVWWRQALSVVNSLREALVRPAAVTPGTARAWISLLLALLVLHLFVAAKPEVGYDANAMHLQFARLFAEYHRWSFDVTRYAWAVMPLGADYAFGAAYILGGEYATRLLNLCFGGLSCLIAYQLICRYARREVALLSVCLFASSPLAFLETGVLLVENLWTAFLLSALLLALDYAKTRSTGTLAALAMLCAGAMQTKVIGLIWVAPLVLYAGYFASQRRGLAAMNRRALLLILAATLIAVWPYANAWLRTGNPLFPFFNDLFHSPNFDSIRPFTNKLYVVPLRPWSIYELFLASGSFIEGRDGAAGFHWLLLLPVIFLAFLRRRPAAQWLCLGLAALFFVVVFPQQAYLRYLLPVLLLITILGGWALSDLPRTRSTRTMMLLLGGTLCLLNLQFMYAASWTNGTLCTSCSVDTQARTNYVATFLPDRAVAEYLNATLPNGRIGFFIVNAVGASGYIGYSRAANWHDVEVFKALEPANSAEDVLAIARRYQLTHAVFVDPSVQGEEPIIPAIGAFRDKYTSPVWRYEGLVVTAIEPES